ncbi:porin family protein [Maricaulis sp. MIT060901]|uniref:porin family protein n=1 Tax=Maricaulis sp. MIT060901 TaxID=3096993 RepID=UPI0039995271
MLRTLFAASAALLALSASSSAQEFNFSGGYERFDFETADFDTIVLRGGYFFNENFGVEGQLNFGFDDDTVTIANTPVNVEFNYGVGAFAVARTGTDGFNVFGRVGYYHSEVEANLAGFNASGDDGALAAGVGAEFDFDDRNSIRLDYTYIDYDDSANVLGLTYVRRFGG